jgi:hypothetical protein
VAEHLRRVVNDQRTGRVDPRVGEDARVVARPALVLPDEVRTVEAAGEQLTDT